MKRFEVIDHTADVGLLAYGNDFKEAFANLACGMFSLIAELDEVHESIHSDIIINSTDMESLVVDWLNELLYVFDVEHIIFSRFDIIHLGETSLSARVYGEKVDRSRHILKREVKAATYHSLKIIEENGCRIQVILDL